MKNQHNICDINISVWFRSSTNEWIGEVKYSVFETNDIIGVKGIAKHPAKTFEAAKYGALARMTGDIMQGIYEIEED